MSQDQYLSFSDPQGPDTVALEEWWEELCQQPNRGNRAELRRSRSPAEVVFAPAYHDLLRRLREAGYAVGPEGARGLAAVAGLAAHLKKQDVKESLARQFARPKEPGGAARLSGLRFRRLLDKQELEDLYLPLMRALKMVDNAANLRDLANSLYWWRKDSRKNWAYQYYGTASQEK